MTGMIKRSKAIEDYLEALLMLEEQGKHLDVSGIASLLKVSRPAATQMADELKNLGYIDKERYSDIVLTEEGRELAATVYHRHKVLKNYLEKLGVSKETAEEDCCRIEHVISDETFAAIEKALEEKH
jgi:Mn-dependent DtxR family transcriptional regulator